jgi:hypothetical protein
MIQPFKIINSYYLTDFGKFAAQTTVLIPADEKHEIPIEYQNRSVQLCGQQLSHRWGVFAGDSQAASYRPVDLDPEVAQRYRMADCPVAQAETAAELKQMVDQKIASVRETLYSTVSGYQQRSCELPATRTLTLDPLDLSDILWPEPDMEAEVSQASPVTENAWKYELTKGDAIEYVGEDGHNYSGLIVSAQHNYDYVLITWFDRAARPTRLPYSLILRRSPNLRNTPEVTVAAATSSPDPLESWRMRLKMGARISYLWEGEMVQDSIVDVANRYSDVISIRAYLAAHPKESLLLLRSDIYPQDCVDLTKSWVYRLKPGDQIKYYGRNYARISTHQEIAEVDHNYDTCRPTFLFTSGDQVTMPYQSIERA